MKVGTLVAVWRDNGQVLITTTRSEAQELGKNQVIHLHGVSGCYALSHVRPVIAIHETAWPILREIEGRVGSIST